MATTSTQGKSPKKAKPQVQSTLLADEIRELIDFIAQSGLNEVDIKTDQIKIRVKRDPDVAGVAQVTTAAPALAAAPAQPATPPQAAEPAPASTGNVEIKSPMIGTFYQASAPDQPAFVAVGDKVAKGQVVCIIEAMKLFNEIESEVSGTVTKIVVNNATPVEYDQPLFEIIPD